MVCVHVCVCACVRVCVQWGMCMVCVHVCVGMCAYVYGVYVCVCMCVCCGMCNSMVCVCVCVHVCVYVCACMRHIFQVFAEELFPHLEWILLTSHEDQVLQSVGETIMVVCFGCYNIQSHITHQAKKLSNQMPSGCVGLN